MFSATTGSANTAVGQGAGLTVETGTYNTLLGMSADVTDEALVNATAIGYNAKVSTSDSLVLGGSYTDAKDVTHTTRVGIGTSSPAYALDVVGDVHVSGTLSAGAKNFKIDDPLDPAHKDLYHASVESSEMMNLYTGNATLDSNGRAIVTLPAWFEALNGEFRYQLTCIGGFAPVYIAEKIHAGHFAIAGGQPGMEVSWQVTGLRHDTWAQQHPLVIEQNKPVLQ
jgi:hypothetical protein